MPAVVRWLHGQLTETRHWSDHLRFVWYGQATVGKVARFTGQ